MPNFTQSGSAFASDGTKSRYFGRSSFTRWVVPVDDHHCVAIAWGNFGDRGDPIEYNKLLSPIIYRNADVVYGSRFFGDERRIHLFWHRVANAFLTTLCNFFTNLNLTDMETCYKVFKKEIITKIDLKENTSLGWLRSLIIPSKKQ